MSKEIKRTKKDLDLEELLRTVTDIAEEYGASHDTVDRVGPLLGESFREMCFKLKYLDRCEPTLCSFRISGECNYPSFASSVMKVLAKHSLIFDPFKSE